MKKKSKLSLSLLVLFVCVGYLGYEFRDKLPIDGLLEKLPFETEEEEEIPQTWATFVQGNDHYSLRYPDVYRISRDEAASTVTFSDGGTPSFLVRVVTPEQRLARGLWVTDRPVERARLGGAPCKKYVTREKEGDVLVHHLSFVAEHEDRLLGLVFRTEKEKLSKVQEKILESFRFDEDVAARAP